MVDSIVKYPAFLRLFALVWATATLACMDNGTQSPAAASLLTTTGTVVTPMSTSGHTTGGTPLGTTAGTTTGGSTPTTTGGGATTAVATTATTGAASTTTGAAQPSAFLTYDVYNCANGDYTTAVTIGDGQSYRLRLDSGTSVSDVASQACSNCGVTPLYSPGTGAQDQGQQSMLGYVDGSGWVAEAYRDVLTLGANMNDVSMVFGAIVSQSFRTDGTGYFFTVSCDGTTEDSDSTQGTLGLGNASAGAGLFEVFADKVHTTNDLADLFAVQLCVEGGHLWWGGYDANATTAAPRYTALDTSTQYYFVDVQNMSLDGQAVGGLGAQSYGPSLVDTGTNVMVLPQPIYQALLSALSTNAAFNQIFPSTVLSGSCFAAAGMTAQMLDAALPKFGVDLLDASGRTWTATVPATASYLQTVRSGGQNLYCGAFISSGGSSNMILGNIFMQSQIVIFDRANKRLGLAPQTGCPAR